MIILIQGKQGSGKGTQAKLLAKKYDLFFFSAGDLSRKLAKENPRIDRLINVEGKLIPTEEMAKYVFDFFDKKYKGKPENIILDGFPRTTRQYKLLSDWLNKKGINIDKAIYLKISDKEAIKRLSSRRMDPKTGRIYNLHTAPKPGPEVDLTTLIHRKDDKPEAIKERISVYKMKTLPMIDFFKKQGKLIEVDGERPIDIIHKDIVKRLEKK